MVLLFRSEEDSGEGSVPELVSADESDTSSGESDTDMPKPDMPELVERDGSESNESGIDEVLYSLFTQVSSTVYLWKVQYKFISSFWYIGFNNFQSRNLSHLRPSIRRCNKPWSWFVHGN